MIEREDGTVIEGGHPGNPKRAGPPSEDGGPAGAFAIANEAMVTEDQFLVIMAWGVSLAQVCLSLIAHHYKTAQLIQQNSGDDNRQHPQLSIFSIRRRWGLAASPGSCRIINGRKPKGTENKESQSVCVVDVGGLASAYDGVTVQHERSEQVTATDDLGSQRFYHGTKADLKPGDLIEPGYPPNFGRQGRKTTYVYLTATLDAAIWGAELALGEAPGRIYVVEPTGPIMDDPNLTDKRYPGNPTKSYRSREPLRVIDEVTDWRGHSPEELKAMKDGLERLKRLGIEPIAD